MSVTINGKFIQPLPTQEGDSQRGHWVRGGFVIEYGDEYTRKAAFSLFGADKVAMVQNIAPNTPVQVSFAPESREYNDRWYTELRCISVLPLAQPQYPQPYQQPGPGMQPQPPLPQAAPTQAAAMPGGPGDDLPF